MTNKHTVQTPTIHSDEPQWLKDVRTRAVAAFEVLPMPPSKCGIDIFSNIHRLPLEACIPRAACDADEMPKADEVVCTDKRVRVMTFQKAIKEPRFEALIKGYLEAGTATRDHKLDAIPFAFFNHSTLIYIPHGVAVAEPIILSALIEEQAQIEHVLVVAEPGSHATIVERANATTHFPSFRSLNAHLMIGEGASIRYMALQTLPQTTYNATSRTATVAKNGSVRWMTAECGSSFTASSIKTLLIGSGAAAHTASITSGSDAQMFDYMHQTVHVAPDTESSMEGRAALGGRAHLLYRGILTIEPAAARSKGFQKIDTLMLSPNAEADPIPILEIENDDVTCNHAASVSRPDAEKLFYMMSRGLAPEEALKEMIRGFLLSVDGGAWTPLLKETIARQASMIFCH